MAEDPALRELLDIVPALRGKRTVAERAAASEHDYKVVTGAGRT